MNETQNKQNDPATSIIPALLTGAVATYLGLTSKGELLKDIATESVSRAVYGQIKNNNFKRKKHRNNKNNCKSKHIHK
jgi:hypothetical protein